MHPIEILATDKYINKGFPGRGDLRIGGDFKYVLTFSKASLHLS